MTPAELVQLHESDKVHFDFLINSIAQSIQREEKGEIATKQFETKRIHENNMDIIYGERAVALKQGDGGIVTRVEASIYFVFDENNRLLSPTEYGDNAALAVDRHMDNTYGGHNKVL
ncbi:hypothetical protein [Sulfuricurvum sp.]|uniref:hypothetical protein n=1 Tax=Sulfuricurvum sp. TaxID=2025608 RepID=UPI003BAF7839